MKLVYIFLSVFLIVSCVNGKENRYTGLSNGVTENNYTGSTPPAEAVRNFLGISLTDSIDFIRWNLTLENDHYHLQCNYGISKPNTNGFIEPHKIELSGALKKEQASYRLWNNDNTLGIAELNTDLLHLMNTDNSLMVGNGGWSYTLNNLKPTGTDEIHFTAGPSPLKDSMVFTGRTPCNIPGVVPSGTECYKLKWGIVLYANGIKNEPGTYRIYGTAYRNESNRTGSWKINTGKNGRIIYQLTDDKGKGLLYLLKLDENVLIFTNEKGELLVGDLDFSYTLNRRS